MFSALGSVAADRAQYRAQQAYAEQARMHAEMQARRRIQHGRYISLRRVLMDDWGLVPINEGLETKIRFRGNLLKYLRLCHQHGQVAMFYGLDCLVYTGLDDLVDIYFDHKHSCLVPVVSSVTAVPAVDNRV